MRDKDLLYFKAIADERSISVVAKRLFTTQSALSYAVKLVKEEIGMPLFCRTPGGLKLTHAGGVLLL